jgi:hypothetical protein
MDPTIFRASKLSLQRNPREWVLGIIAPHLSPAQLTDCLNVVQQSDDPLIRVLGLVALLPHLPDPVRQQATESAKATAWSIDPSDWRFPLALAPVVTFLSGEEREKTILQCLSHLRLGHVGTEEALTQLLPFLDPELLKIVLEWMRQSTHLTLLPDIVERLLPHLTKAEIEELAGHLHSHTVRYPAISKDAQCLARLQLSPYLSQEEVEPILNLVIEKIKETDDSYLFQNDIYKRMIAHLNDQLLSEALNFALRYDCFYRIRALRILIPRLEGTHRETAIQILINDILSLEGGEAVVELDRAIEFFSDDQERLKLMKKELIQRLYVDRGKERSAILHILRLPKIFSERVLSRSVLSLLGEQVIDICDGWSWA